MNFIYTVNPCWTSSVLLDMTEAGIHYFRINAVRQPKTELEQIVNCIKKMSPLNRIFFDLPGVKARIWFFSKESKKVKIYKNEIYEFSFCQHPRELPIFQITGHDLFKEISNGALLKVRRNKNPLIRFCVLSKKEHPKKIIVQALDDGVIGWGYHIYSDKMSSPQHTIQRSDLEYVDIINKCQPQNICISFTDHPDMVRDLKSNIKYDSKNIFAKIETRFGVKNLEEISQIADGIIIARDDLSAYYSVSQISEIANKIICLCEMAGKISIPASNYFTSLCESEDISDFEFDELKKLVSKNQKFIYCNETNKCDDWRRFRRVEMRLNK